MRRSPVGWVALAVAIALLAWGVHALVPALSGGVAMGVATVLLLLVTRASQRFRK